MVKILPANAGVTRDAGLMAGSGRSPGGGNSNPLQYSCLEIPWTEAPGGIQSMGLQRVRHDGAYVHAGTYIRMYTHTHTPLSSVTRKEVNTHTHTHTHTHHYPQSPGRN